MNYHKAEELNGHTLAVGDMFGLCSVGHLVHGNFVENLGGCGNIWALNQLGIDFPDSFLQRHSPDKKVYVNGDAICFKSDGLEELTSAVIELMELSEKEECYVEFDEDDY